MQTIRNNWLKLVKTFLVWVLALQILNMSMWSEAYSHYYTGEDSGNYSNKQADPTETVVEWLVEMKMGQQDAFNYNHNIDCKNTTKAIGWQIDLENQGVPSIPHRQTSRIIFPYTSSKLQHVFAEVQSPPPDGGFCFQLL
ncbi:MAG TPA: hypothetical protein VGZ90_15200 [Puia sp.]|nr:hypothetical protein [Puia sp.]